MSGRRCRPRPRVHDEFQQKKQDLLSAWNDEVCNSEEVPEVEIVSLLQETIPKYRLRADSITQFAGYENQDWFIPSPALPLSDEDLQLSPDQIRETLNYFLLCSNRVSQMTKTYNDIEAVTRLLEEKEKDLELTARIGKELLATNGRLEATVAALEAELKSSRDLCTQLRHELSTKSDLLQVLTNDTEDATSPTEPEPEPPGAVALRKRTTALERENRALRDEASRLAAGADLAELAERQLLRDIATQLASANSEASVLGSQLLDERQRNADLQQQLDTTNARLGNAERALLQVQTEHSHTLRILEITKENQNALAAELADTKERYAEVAAHLAETQEQLRNMRKRGDPARGLMPSVAQAAGLMPAGLMPASLHREMHSSVYSELSLDSGIGDQTNTSMQRVFETVACASRWSAGGGGGGSGSVCGSDIPSVCNSTSLLLRDRNCFLDTADTDTASDSEPEDLYPGGSAVGVPGAPGAAELAAALRRLTPQEISSRRASLTASHVLRHRRSQERGPMEESAVWGAGGGRLPPAPHRLQIVKPLEGSFTLHTWAQLAKPNMAGLMEEQEGVAVRGARAGSGGAGGAATRLYRLSDVEEDDDMPRLPYAPTVYTFTNSTVLHPSDGSMMGSSMSSVCSSGLSSLSSSVLGSAWSSRLSSRRTSRATSPVMSRRDSIVDRRYTPTATPANSPLLGSPDASPPPSPRPGEPPSLHALIQSGTSILRRRPLASPNGEPSHLPVQTPGSLYTGLMHRSPMEQLTCLKRALRSPAAPRADPHSPPAASVAPAAGVAGTLPRRPKTRTARPRADLGTVGGPAPAAPAPEPPRHCSPLGTLSSIFFGRKGGLL